MPKTLRIFVGSSEEGLQFAKQIQALLYEEEDGPHERGIVVKGWWSNGAFRVGDTFIENLERLMRETDAAILLATGDDITTSRGETDTALRDNITLETGMSISAHGRDLTALAVVGAPKLPSDLKGVTYLPLEEGKSWTDFRERNRGRIRALLDQWQATLDRRGSEQRLTAADYEEVVADPQPSHPVDDEATSTDSEIGNRLVKTVENYDASLLSRTNLIWSYPVNWIAVPGLCKAMNLNVSTVGHRVAAPRLVTVGEYKAFQEQYKWRQLGYNVPRTFQSENGIQAISGVSEQYLADLIKDAGSDPFKDRHDAEDPVGSVSWFDAVAFCLAVRARLPTLDELGELSSGNRRWNVWEWTQSWFDRSSAHVAVHRGEARPVGVNPDLRLKMLGFRVIHSK